MTNPISVAERIEEVVVRFEDIQGASGQDTSRLLGVEAALLSIAQDARTAEAVRRDEDRQKYSQGYMAACGRAERAEARITELEKERETLLANMQAMDNTAAKGFEIAEEVNDSMTALVAENARMLAVVDAARNDFNETETVAERRALRQKLRDTLDAYDGGEVATSPNKGARKGTEN